MAGMLWAILGAALAVAIASVLLVRFAARRRRADLARLADARGWDYQPVAPVDLVRQVRSFGVKDVLGRDLLAGPSAAGPFRLCTLGPERGRATLTLLHLRTAAASPGLRVAPSPRFRLFRPSSTDAPRPDHASFRRRYTVRSADAAFADAALDHETCALLLRPRAGVSMVWEGHDMLFLFPLAADRPRGAEVLLAYATAVARRMDPHAPSPATAAPSGRERAPAPAGVPV